MNNKRGIFFKKEMLFVILFSVFRFDLYSQVNIHVQIKGAPARLTYYAPLGEFANPDIETIHPNLIEKSVLLDFPIQSPTFIQISVNGIYQTLISEPGDTILLEFDSNTKAINYFGRNSIGNYYYNHLLESRPNRLNRFVSLIKEHLNSSPDTILNVLDREYYNQTKWVDSLFNQKLVTEHFKSSIHASMYAWFAGSVCSQLDIWFNSVSHQSLVNSSVVKSRIFSRINPLDVIYKGIDGNTSLYFSYFKKTYEDKHEPSSLISSSQTQAYLTYFSMAPADIESYLWGRILFIHNRYKNYISNQNSELDICKVYKKYIQRFGQTPYASYFRISQFCLNTKSTID